MLARYFLSALLVTGTVFGFSTIAHADIAVNRTLRQSISVPTGDSIKVENLVGHMSVTQGSGPPEVIATVIAGGDQAQVLAENVKLDVTTASNIVTVHVHYPVDRYSKYLYNPPQTTENGTGNYCALGFICVRWNNSDLRYQGTRVQVYRNALFATPLYVNLVVQLPAGIKSTLVNKVGRVDARNLANTLTINTSGSDVYVTNLTGNLETNTHSGDVHIHGLNGSLQANTGSGDLTADQINGDVHADTGSGDLRISDAVTHTVYADTGSGDATLKQVVGQVTLDTGSGDANLDEVSGSLHIDTGSGDLVVTHYTASQNLWVDTGSGDAHLSGNLSALRSLYVDTGSGDAVLKTTANLSMHLEAFGDGGDVNISLPDVTNIVSKDDYFSGDIGKATGHGTIHSGGGDITVTQP